ncbi:MAG: TetR/AcrR family transcriptional regulator [Hyphomicrobiales bacterium]|nr:TetR/AcrR family transcriptional regulator [Hyphomicrobiales bacterium]
MSNRDSREARYHHGDLRAALVAEGIRLLTAGGASDLSLRVVAGNVGVSATAVYRHFPDKDALQSAVSEEGFRRLGQRQAAASAAAGQGQSAGFLASGAAYVRFALENPALFRLMFSRPTAASRQSEAAALLGRNAAAFAPGGVDPDIFALQAWSIAHGLAMLMLDRLAPADEMIVEKVLAGLLVAQR